MDNKEEEKIVVTEEMAAKYRGKRGEGKGRPVKAHAKQIIKLNKKQKKKDKRKEWLSKVPERERKIAIRRNKVAINRDVKLDIFMEEFIKNGGNATQAALVATKTKSIKSASALGTHYLRQAKELGRVYYEKKGYGYGKLLELAAKKMEAGKTPEWWDRIMKLSGYEDFITKDKKSPQVVTNIINAHKDMTSQYIEDVEAENDKD